MTQWSVISNARGADDQQATEGLQQLALAYWRPLYLYLRKCGENHSDASDSVQGFFEFMISSEFLSYVDREGGKFRSYLLKSLERWRNRQRERANTQKRGGRLEHTTLDGLEEMREVADLPSAQSPETAFDQQWAMEMVARSVSQLEEDYARRGRMEWFEALRPVLPGGVGLGPSAELAEALQVSDNAVRKGIFDLRQAFTNRLKEEIRATVRSNEDAEDELRYLVEVLARG